MKLDIGCGKEKRPGYVGVDFGGDSDIQADLTKPLPFEDGVAEALYASHSLEHFTDSEAMDLLAEMYRIAKPECVLEICVPDFPQILQAFLDAPWKERWTWHLMTIFGNQEGAGQLHRTGYDGDKLAGMVEYAGFKVENVEEVWTHNQRCIYLKATK